MKNLLPKIAFLLFLGIVSCQTQEGPLSEKQKQNIVQQSTEVVKAVFDHSNALEFTDGLQYYSDSPEAFYISDGKPNTLKELYKNYTSIAPSVELLHNTITAWNTQVLAKDLVVFTLPVELTIKLKDKPEFTGKLIWTATVQQQNNKWTIVQSHESWLDCAAVAAAFSEP